MRRMLLILSMGFGVARALAGYDPLHLDAAAKVEVRDCDIRDAKRGRTIPVRIYATPGGGPMPLVLFSHGLGGSRVNNAYLGNHWAARGYRVVVMQHAGSDSGVWQDVAPARRLAAMRGAASVENFSARNADVTATLDQILAWNAGRDHWLHGRIDPAHVGMSGHSFGAVTTQAVSGESFPAVGPRFTDPRIRAACAFSPSPPQAGNPEHAFGAVRLPWLLMTGTADNSPIGNTRAADRLKVYPALPAGGKYELVLDQADHMTFSDRDLLGRPPRDPRFHRAITAVSTAFWDATLRGSAEAVHWLRNEARTAVLVPADSWKWK